MIEAVNIHILPLTELFIDNYTLPARIKRINSHMTVKLAALYFTKLCIKYVCKVPHIIIYRHLSSTYIYPVRTILKSSHHQYPKFALKQLPRTLRANQALLQWLEGLKVNIEVVHR